jgi:tripartite-type tricarboxylate transporter receptor subunit TctC
MGRSMTERRDCAMWGRSSARAASVERPTGQRFRFRSSFRALVSFGARLAVLSIAPLLPSGGITTAAADPVADFYRGKQIRMVVRTTPGGDYHQYSHLLSRFMPKHIPGNPQVILNHMPGGGGIVAANFMATVAPRDGTVMGIVSQGLILDQALALSPQLKADLKQFNWIANIVDSNQLLVVWHTSSIRSIEDARKRDVLIGTTGAGSASVQYPSFMNNVLGTRFKLVSGYISGTEIDLAMERGEVEGRGTNPYSGYMASRPTWIPEGKIIPIIQSGIKKEPALPHVPLIMDQDVPAASKPLLEMLGRASSFGRPLATTQGVPAERVEALRKAFIDTIADPELKAAAAKESLEIRPMTGDELTALVNGILDAPADVRERMKAALEPKGALTQTSK